MKHLTNLDLNKNEIQNARIQNLATAPDNPVEGQIYYNTTDKRAYQWNGTAWVGMDSVGATMSGENIVTAINTQATKVDFDNISIDDKGITNAKIADMAANTIKGRSGTSGVPQDLTKAQVLSILNVADGAQVNAVTSVNTRTGEVVVTKTDVALENVTNDAQVKKAASSVNGNVPVWSGTAGDTLGAGYPVETTLVGGADKLARADAIKTYIDALLSANDAMVFKGTLGSGGTVTVLPTTHSAGWTYKVITAGTYAGVVCEVGDLAIAVVDRAGSGNLNSDWSFVQTNLDGAVTGPASAVADRIAVFNGTTGKIIKDGGVLVNGLATSGHNHDGTYTKKYVTTLGGSTAQVVTHNLNTRDLVVTIRETGSPYAQVMADVEFTTVNTVTVKFAVAPSAAQFTITLVG